MFILDFCDKKGSTRPFSKTPFSWGGKTVATDGIIIVFKNEAGPWPKINDNGYPVDGVKECFDFINSPGLVFEPLVAKQKNVIGKFCKTCNGSGFLIETTCPECYGDGVLDFNSDYHTYSVECKTCDGLGTINIAKTICNECGGYGCIYPDFEAQGVRIQYQYLQKLQTIQNCEVAGIKEKYSLIFKNEAGVCGLVMGIAGDSVELH